MSDPVSHWVQVAEVSSSPLGPGPIGGTHGSCVVARSLAAELETHHSRVFEVAAFSTPFGDEALTRDVPNVGDARLADLDDQGLVRVGTRVGPGDLLVGKITPRGGALLSPEEKLLRAIFGERAGDVRDTSLRVPPGTAGAVTSVRRESPGEGELARIAVEVSWSRPLEVGDILVDDAGNRATVAAIRDAHVPLQWGDGGSRRIAKAALARDRMHARSIGPYSLVTQQPLRDRGAFGGQEVSAGLLAALVEGGLAWAAWELLTLKSDSVAGRTRAYESLVKGEHPAPWDRGGAPPGAPNPLFSLFRADEGRGPDRVPATLPESVLVAERELLALGFDTAVDADPVRGTWLTSAQIRERSHGRIEKPETVNYRTLKPEPGGLFCERIFGPVKDYECACGKYKRMKYRGVTCEQCGVEVIGSSVRRERFGHVDLPVRLPHPWRLDEIAAFLGLAARDLRRVVLGEADLTGEGDVVAASEAFERMGGAALQRLLGEGSELLLDALLVLPPDLRPLVPLDGGRWATSDLNDQYRRVINRRNRLARLLDLNAPSVILRNEAAQLYLGVEALFDNARTEQPFRHDGRILRSLRDVAEPHLRGVLAKLVDYSGVAHLMVDETLPEDTCRLPREVATELFKPMAYGLMEARGYVVTIKSAKRAVEERQDFALAAIRDVAAAWPVLLTTGRGIAPRRVELWDAAAIAVAPGTADRLAAEEVVLHVPLTAPAVEGARRLVDRVLPVGSAAPRASGWLTELLLGGDLPEGLRAAGAGEVDRVADPVLGVGLGRWPDEGCLAVPWLTEAVIGRREEPPDPLGDQGSRSVDELELSVASATALQAAGIRTIGELCRLTEAELLKTGRVGRRELGEIRELLEGLGLGLGAR
jgi:hypothetical protein